MLGHPTENAIVVTGTLGHVQGLYAVENAGARLYREPSDRGRARSGLRGDSPRRCLAVSPPAQASMAPEAM